MVLRVRKLKNIELNRLTPEAFKSQQKIPLVIVLDNIRSLNNVGSVFRTADCLGIGKIYLCGITGKPPHRDIHKTSLGAENSIEWDYFESITALLKQLKSQDYQLCALEQTDNSIDIREFQSTDRPLALILGNEIDGVSDEAIALCDTIVEIPQFGTKHSFNVAVSAGIALWEIKQKMEG